MPLLPSLRLKPPKRLRDAAVIFASITAIRFRAKSSTEHANDRLCIPYYLGPQRRARGSCLGRLRTPRAIPQRPLVARIHERSYGPSRPTLPRKLVRAIGRSSRRHLRMPLTVEDHPCRAPYRHAPRGTWLCIERVAGRAPGPNGGFRARLLGASASLCESHRRWHRSHFCSIR